MVLEVEALLVHHAAAPHTPPERTAPVRQERDLLLLAAPRQSLREQLHVARQRAARRPHPQQHAVRASLARRTPARPRPAENQPLLRALRGRSRQNEPHRRRHRAEAAHAALHALRRFLLLPAGGRLGGLPAGRAGGGEGRQAVEEVRQTIEVSLDDAHQNLFARSLLRVSDARCEATA